MHTGPSKGPKQLLLTMGFSFHFPVLTNAGLLAASGTPSRAAADSERAVAAPIQKVGMVEIRDANYALKTGEQVFQACCCAFHQTGARGHPNLAMLPLGDHASRRALTHW